MRNHYNWRPNSDRREQSRYIAGWLGKRTQTRWPPLRGREKRRSRRREEEEEEAEEQQETDSCTISKQRQGPAQGKLSQGELKIISDAAHIITNVEAKWPGSVHDSRMYLESTLSNRLERGEIDGFLLGDRGYPCRPTLITPYPEPEPGPQQRFNVAHCRTRAQVEMTLGLLKARFQCLRHLRVTSERSCDIIVACVVLHNIGIIRGEQHPCPTNTRPRGRPHQPCRFPVWKGSPRYDMPQCLLRLIHMISSTTTNHKIKKK
ncbi:putative nuclease HARBI1 isoform X3 [Xyrauchen texanus]|uniref:putative nuclease HARBI1 isoform X3 n=1 Tax=Xyrauchen texanus TaxID=154827 RepID=UPI00224276F9|nr:putative nuclease HARBI1 isoform X3 [Xyrauchen texanus]